MGDRFVERNCWLFCNGREKREREAEKRLEERERKWGEKERGPSNGNKTGTHMNLVRI